MGKLVSIAKQLLPAPVFQYFKRRTLDNVFKKLRQEYPAYRERMLRRAEEVRRKEVINVLFYIWQPSFWKVDSLFRLMLEHPRFNPIVCPVAAYDYTDPEERQSVLEETRRYFKQKGYPVLEIEGVGPVAKSFVLTGRGVEKIREAFAPDIIFVQTPYETVQESVDADMEHELYCYVPYGFRNSGATFSFDNATQNKYLFNFVENEYIAELAKSKMSNGGANVCLTGYPPVDMFAVNYADRTDESAWKVQDAPCKKVIWAPHWALGTGSIMQNGVFSRYADAMLELARSYAGRVQFAFKPHPKLMPELYMHPEWGVERTDAYYAAWELLPNAQLEQGEYASLFRQSDGMIHDSGSFIVEYLMTGNPCCFFHVHEDYPSFNKMTHDALAAHYWEDSIAGVRRYIDSVILGTDDPLAAARKEFFDSYLMPPKGVSAAQNIVDAILGKLSNPV